MTLDRLATSLTAALVQDPTAGHAPQELIERAYRELRHVGGHVALRRDESGEFQLSAALHEEPIDLRGALEKTKASFGVQSLQEVFERCGMRAVAFLPDVDLLEFELALALFKEGGAFMQLKLMERLVHRVLVLNSTPMLMVKREVSIDVKASLDAVFLSMTGIDRAGCGEEKGPDDVLRGHGEAIFTFLDSEREMAEFLASLDLVLHAYPADVQRGVLRVLARTVPEASKTACEEKLEALGQQGDGPESPRPEGVSSALAALRGEDLPELSFSRRPRRVRRLHEDTSPNQTLPLAIPPPLLPVEQVAGEALAGKREVDEWVKEESLPGIVLEGPTDSVVAAAGNDSPPPGMADRIATYRERSSQLLARAAAATAGEFPQCVKALGDVGLHLIGNGEFAETWGIVRFLLSQRNQAPRGDEASQRALERAHDAIVDPARAQALCEALPHVTFAEQGAIFEILLAMGPSCVEAILEINASHHLGPSLRGSVLAHLEGMGPGGVEPLASYLQRHKSRIHRLTPLVEVLGTLDYGPARDQLLSYATHTVAAVREAALVGLFRSMGKEAESILVAALQDEESAVCQKAITLLGIGRCDTTEFMNWLYRLVVSPNPADVREEAVVLAALRAIRALGNVSLGSGRQAEIVLIARLGLERRLGLRNKGWPTRELRVENDLTPRVQEAYCRTLGSIGTEASTTVLEVLASHGIPNVRRGASKALVQIHSRGTSAIRTTSRVRE